MSVNGSALFHSLLFACQRGLMESAGGEATRKLLPFVREYLERSGISGLLDETETDDPVDLLENLGEALAESNLIQSYEAMRTEKGLDFAAKGCVFAKKVHASLDPRDVTCPYGMLAIAIIEKRFGRCVNKAISTFTPSDSETSIEFSPCTSSALDRVPDTRKTDIGVET